VTMLTESRAWEVLGQVPDPEIPVISVTELGIVREIRTAKETVTVIVTPTYSGCPATEVIEHAIREALIEAGAPSVRIETRLSPAWTTDWIQPEGAEKLRGYGIVPPAPAGEFHVLRFRPPTPACPRCGERKTERLSEFGSTACKAMYRCPACREPFEYFKPI
jgi:ring-1,2-phenylacetyl-CoA epoxidase subunit PaaD